MNLRSLSALLVSASAFFLHLLPAQGQEGPPSGLKMNPNDAILRAEPIEGDIQDTAEDLFKFANLLYSNGQYKEAQVKYTEFLAAHPTSPNVEKTWYQLGDCYLNMQRLDEAKKCFDNVIKNWPTGKYVAPAAYRMAEITFNRNQFKDAVPYLRTAIKGFTDPALQLEAQFFLAHALQMAGNNAEAIKEYEVVMASGQSTPYRERAQLDLAKLLLDRGDSEKALVHFTELASKAADPVIKDEARFKAGILSLSSKDQNKATAFLRQTLENSKNEKFKSEAQIALMLQAWEDKDYNKVIEYYSLAPLQSSGPALADLEMMLAHSYRHLKKYALAVSAYDSIARNFEGTTQATEAGYRKLQCYYQSGDKELSNAVDRYVQDVRKQNPNVKFIDLALLLKAEALYAKADYGGAAEAYQQVRTENIDSRYAPVRLYKMGWALAESGRHADGIDALGEFVSLYPKHNLVPSALAQRGSTYQRMGNEEAALKDFKTIAEKHPDFENSEYVLRTIALIYAGQRKWPQAVAAYRDLLKKYPDSSVKAEANYWIGRGLFSEGKYQEAIPSLEKARDLDPKEYSERASLSIIIAHFNVRNDVENLEVLMRETNAFLVLGSTIKIPSEILEYLGTTLYKKKDFGGAEKYLKKIADYSKPQSTKKEVWDMLANIRLQKKDYAAAIKDFDNYLVHRHVLHPETESRARLDKAGCHMKLAASADNTNADGAKKKVEQLGLAKTEADVVLDKIRRGKLNSEARIILGDIAMAKSLPDEAAQNYVIVCEFGHDPDLVPQALSKIIAALNSQGKTAQAQVYQDQLNAQYPDYKQQG